MRIETTVERFDVLRDCADHTSFLDLFWFGLCGFFGIELIGRVQVLFFKCAVSLIELVFLMILARSLFREGFCGFGKTINLDVESQDRNRVGVLH